MKYHLKVSLEAKTKISQIADCVFTNWGLSVYQNLLDELDHCFHIYRIKSIYISAIATRHRCSSMCRYSSE